MPDLKSEKSLSQKVIIGGAWIFALRIVERILGFLKIIILARLLAPEDFGLFGVALLTLSTLETFSNTGFQNALIQKKENIGNYLNTVWTISTLRGIVLYLIVFFIAPYVAIFFNNPESSIIIRIVGLTIIFRGVLNVGTIYFQKELEFNKQFVLQFISSFIEFIVAITCAIILKSFWALVIGQLCGSLTFLITSYIIHPYRPRFNIELEKAKELFNYGKWIFGSSILVFLITHGDDAFVGRLLGVTMLGFYQMAYRISNMATTEISHVIANVTFPAFSKMVNNKKRLKESFLRTVSFISYLSFPLAVLTFLLADDLVFIVLSDKWAPIIPIIKILCVEGLFRSIGASTGPLLSGIGKPKYITYFTTIRLILLALLIYPLTSRWGLIGTSYAVISGALLSPFIFGKILKIISCPVKEFLKSMMIPVISTIIISCILIIIKNYVLINPSITRFILIIMISTLVYLHSSFFLETNLKYPILKPLIASFRKK